MTQKARQLGMASTVFRNASGLPNPEQVTTARDMARLANACCAISRILSGLSVLNYNYHGRPLANHNRMLVSYAGAEGLKTGYTNASGFNLVMSAMRDNRRLIGVVMGGNSAFQRDRLMAELMDQGFVTAQAQAMSPGPRRACRRRRATRRRISCPASARRTSFASARHQGRARRAPTARTPSALTLPLRRPASPEAG
jgi:D-alanyl-D-alanine carboxypeptidase